VHPLRCQISLIARRLTLYSLNFFHSYKKIYVTYNQQISIFKYKLTMNLQFSMILFNEYACTLELQRHTTALAYIKAEVWNSINSLRLALNINVRCILNILFLEPLCILAFCKRLLLCEKIGQCAISSYIFHWTTYTWSPGPLKSTRYRYIGL